jgi:putative aldouronate transport system permease protein
MRTAAVKVKSLKVKSTGYDLLFNIIVYSSAVIIMLIIIYPLFFIVIASFSDPAAVSTGQVWFGPVGFTLEGYVALLNDQSIWTGYRNTILYAGVGTLISLMVNIPAAYTLSRKDLVFRTPLTFYFLITMFFSGGLIPIFLTVRQFGLYDTFWVMVLPFSVSIYNIIVARTFFQGNIPEDLRESAEIDGCGNLRFFFTFVLPLSKAIIAVLALWSMVDHWNSYFNALIYLRNISLYPLQLILRNILISNEMMSALSTGEAAQIALRTSNLIRYGAIIVSTAPIMCVYPFLQKYFNQGVMIGAVKG